MCGRYSLTTDARKLAEHFDLRESAIPEQLQLFERYNIAPSQPVPIIRQNLDNHKREFVLVNWGLIPIPLKTRA